MRSPGYHASRDFIFSLLVSERLMLVFADHIIGLEFRLVWFGLVWSGLVWLVCIGLSRSAWVVGSVFGLVFVLIFVLVLVLVLVFILAIFTVFLAAVNIGGLQPLIGRINNDLKDLGAGEFFGVSFDDMPGRFLC